VDYQAVKENSVPSDPQLDGAKELIAAWDLYTAMISIPVDLRVTQEIPDLATGEQGSGID